jgi:hypothetical protein
LSKAAIDAGDRQLAKAIKALRKPSLVGWALNQLVRQRRTSVEELIALGDDLRTAQAALSGDDLRALGRQRHQLVRAVATQAVAIAAEAGVTLSTAVIDQVTTSLDAALTDKGNAELLLGGQLTGALDYAGLGDPPPPKLAVVRDVPAQPTMSKAEERKRAKEREAAAAAVRTAKRELDEAERHRLKAREVLAAAHLRAGLAQERLSAATEEWEAARADEDAAVLAEHTAARSAEIADLHFEQARAHAASLDD